MKPKRLKLMMERYFLFEPNVHMNVVFTVEGDVSAEKLKEAVNKAYTQNQTTMSKAVFDDKGDLYLEEMAQSGCHVYIDSRDWQEIRREQEKIPFRINEGEFLRTFIIPGGQNTAVYLMIHHMTCDGSGLFLLIEDIMNNLAGNEVAYKPTVVLTKRQTIHKGDLTFKERLFLKLLNRKWRKVKQIFTWEDYYKIHETYWKNKSSYVDMTVVEGEELKALRQECKDLNVTVNSYLMAKFLKDYPEYKNLGMPISLRNGERSVSNLVASLTVNFDYDQSKTFQENAVVLDQMVRPRLKDQRTRFHTPQFLAIMEPTLVDAALMHHILGYESELAKVMGGLVGYYGKRYTELGLTNMRVVDIPSQYGDYRIGSITGAPPSISTAEKVMGVFTFNDRMTIIDTRVEET